MKRRPREFSEEWLSIRSLSAFVTNLIDKNDINHALVMLHDIVIQIITEPLCTSQVFGSQTLDDLCVRIGKISLENVKQEISKIGKSQFDQPVFVYVVTKLQKSGGHTQVVKDFIKAQADGFHVILSTELDGKSDLDYLDKELLSKQTKVAIEQAPKTDFHKRLAWLQTRLLELAPTKVYLFNHHQDSVAVAAIPPEMNLDASFCHHGDHHLCLGVYLAHLKHIDLHPMGYHTCRSELGINNSYVPLTLEDKGVRSSCLPFKPDGTLTTCTAARSNKVEVPYFISYAEIIPELLAVTGGKHIHIGRLTPWVLYKIRRGLKSNGTDLNRFIYISWVPSVWKALHEYRVDLYLASFPYGGGLTLIEAMGAGVPVVLHRHIFSRILSSLELAYPGAFSWRYPEELFNYCTLVTPDDLRQGGCWGRIQYEKFHRPECLQEALNTITDDGIDPGCLSGKFIIADDERALWMEQQLNFKRLFSRAIYRIFKHLRAQCYK